MLKRNDQGPGRTNFFRHHSQQLNGNRGNPAAFQLGCDQTHGLVAHRSHRNQQGDVHVILNQFVRDRRKRFFDQASGGGQRSHQG